MSTAVDIYLNQIVLTGGIPFSVSIPAAPPEIDVSRMTSEQFFNKLEAGISDGINGRYKDADVAFAELEKKLGI